MCWPLKQSIEEYLLETIVPYVETDNPVTFRQIRIHFRQSRSL